MSRQFTCSICGKSINLTHYHSQAPLARLMRVETLCFDCAFWMDYISHPQPDTAIVSGRLYIFRPIIKYINPQQRRCKGMTLARNMKTGAIVGCKNCRYIADIPESFKTQLPDQYRFISEETYRIISERECQECLAKGCWDRYHCFWYNATKAEPGKPWNKIPHYHKPGGELCESFINKETMYNLQ